jgi:hypothetical protein
MVRSVSLNCRCELATERRSLVSAETKERGSKLLRCRSECHRRSNLAAHHQHCHEDLRVRHDDTEMLHAAPPTGIRPRSQDSHVSIL